jgi:hypothetical protein
LRHGVNTAAARASSFLCFNEILLLNYTPQIKGCIVCGRSRVGGIHALAKATDS